MTEPKTARYQVTLSVVRIESYLEERVRLAKVTQLQLLEAIGKQLLMQVRDDTTRRFGPGIDPKTKQRRERGSAGFYIGGKIVLPED